MNVIPLLCGCSSLSPRRLARRGDNPSGNRWICVKKDKWKSVAGVVQRPFSVRFRPDLGPWPGDPPPAFVRLAAVDGVLVPTHPDHRWVTMRPIRTAAPEDPAEFVTEQLGVDVAPEVLGDDTWVAAVQYAQDFSRGRVFLIGDAAH